MTHSSARFVLFIAFMFALTATQLQWLSHAPIATQATQFYEGQLHGWFNIDLLAMVYMLVFLLLSFPASYVIDTYGLRKSLILGSAILIVASVIKAIWVKNFTLVLAAQITLAVAQPFLLNAITTLTMHWFSPSERGIAAGLAVFSQYLGMLGAMALGPLFIDYFSAEAGLQWLMYLYGAMGLIGGAALIIAYPSNTANEVPHTPTLSFTEGLKLLVHSRDMLILLVLFFIGLGIINAISSLIDSIVSTLTQQHNAGWRHGWQYRYIHYLR